MELSRQVDRLSTATALAKQGHQLMGKQGQQLINPRGQHQVLRRGGKQRDKRRHERLELQLRVRPLLRPQLLRVLQPRRSSLFQFEDAKRSLNLHLLPDAVESGWCKTAQHPISCTLTGRIFVCTLIDVFSAFVRVMHSHQATVVSCGLMSPTTLRVLCPAERLLSLSQTDITKVLAPVTLVRNQDRD